MRILPGAAMSFEKCADSPLLGGNRLYKPVVCPFPGQMIRFFSRVPE